MHPKSKDRSGNAKLLERINREQGLPPPGHGRRTRDSPLGRRLRELRDRKSS